MNTESDQNKLLQKFKNLRKEPQIQVDYLTNAINDIEEVSFIQYIYTISFHYYLVFKL